MGELRFKNFGFNYSSKCNLKCRHCIVDSNSKKKSKMNPRTVKKQLRQMARFNESHPKKRIEYLGFSGGEALLFVEELLEIFSLAAELGFNTGLVSNGSWALTEEKARDMLASLKRNGLRNLVVSRDRFHSEFVPEENYLNILRAYKKTKAPKLSLQVLRSTDLTYLDYVKKAIPFKEPIISLQSLMPIGRAKNLGKKTFVLEKIPTEAKCPSVSSPVLDFNQDIFLCCLAGVKKDSPLVLSNVREKSLHRVLEEALVDPMRNAMNALGPVRFAREVWESKKPLPLEKKKFVNPCHYCLEALSGLKRREVYSVLREKGY